MPYRKETSPSEMHELIHQGRIELSRLTKAERGVIEKAIALDPAERWPTCIDMVRAYGPWSRLSLSTNFRSLQDFGTL